MYRIQDSSIINKQEQIKSPQSHKYPSKIKLIQHSDVCFAGFLNL